MVRVGWGRKHSPGPRPPGSYLGKERTGKRTKEQKSLGGKTKASRVPWPPCPHTHLCRQDYCQHTRRVAWRQAPLGSIPQSSGQAATLRETVKCLLASEASLKVLPVFPGPGVKRTGIFTSEPVLEINSLCWQGLTIKLDLSYYFEFIQNNPEDRTRIRMRQERHLASRI